MGEKFGAVLDAARTGAEWAWSELYLDLAPPVLGYLRARGSMDAEDLTQEVFVSAVRGLPAFEGDEENFRSWIFVIAHNRLIDERRSRTRHPVDPSPMESLEAAGGNVEDEFMNGVESADMRRVLASLTPIQRDVILLRVVGGLSAEDIAPIVKRSYTAVKQVQRRGLRLMARLLSEKALAS
ncbi:MAG: sigma-70 family RNA polymerase sigma factor [Actinomycetota bacterium]